jgi:arginyl-tRNA--protein-N-Asp/Glu arginylyltransferase
MKVEDLEHCLNMGFTRCGTYIYKRTSHMSCCEVWQYRVDVNDFKISPQQKKTIRRFHNYLNYGDIHGPKSDESKIEE